MTESNKNECWLRLWHKVCAVPAYYTLVLFIAMDCNVPWFIYFFIYLGENCTQNKIHRGHEWFWSVEINTSFGRLKDSGCLNEA